ncbi:MAG TPA: NADH-quinone oxidoreductase subunit N [Candidatus Acidoferrales bacterium]|nr:NADH-quinone oxidoreductase subunit N [Candidatus Acidoferrales bacterium]
MPQDLLSRLGMQLPKEFALILPQVQLGIFALGILLTDFLLDRRSRWWNAVLALAGVGFSAKALKALWSLTNPEDVLAYHNSIIVDPFAVFFGFLFLISAALVILLSVRYLEIEEEHHGEFYALLLLATIGMMFLASGNDLITLFLGLETMALSFYILSGFLRSRRASNEGAVKYLLLGAFSSGILAYGFSLMYGIAGSTNLNRIAQAYATRPAHDPLVLISLVTVSAGVFFKIAAVPFHMWAPDVYEGAPTSITASISVASKAASFALLLRLFCTAFWPIRPDWEMVVAGVAIASMTIGNFGAITQDNLKRLLAYSSIAHVGYMLLGLVSGTPTGFQGIAFYLLVYVFMNTGAFAIVILLRRQGVIGENIEDLNGLISRRPVAAILLLIFMLSLAGIPPTAGFLGKYFIFLSLIETGHYVLAIFGALYIAPALYYYFRVVVHAWMREPAGEARPVISVAQGVALAACTLFILVAGLLPEEFIKFAGTTLKSQFLQILR